MNLSEQTAQELIEALNRNSNKVSQLNTNIEYLNTELKKLNKGEDMYLIKEKLDTIASLLDR